MSDRSEYNRAWREANQERMREHKRNYRRRHMAEMAEYMREYRAGKRRPNKAAKEPTVTRWRCCGQVRTDVCPDCGYTPVWLKGDAA